MGTKGGPNIVTNDIVLYLDSDNIKSYGEIIESTTNLFTHPVKNAGFSALGTGTFYRTDDGNDIIWKYTFVNQTWTYHGMYATVEVGKSYTVSCDMFVSSNHERTSSTVMIGVEMPGGGGTIYPTYDMGNKGKWQSIVSTTTATSNGSAAILMYPNTTNGYSAGYVLYRNLQFERKDHATPFTSTSRTSTWKDLSNNYNATLNNNVRCMTPTGGEIINTGTHILHIFKSSGYFDPGSFSGNVELLVVGGGGGGGMDMGGGGGGGGVQTSLSYSVSSNTPIRVGVGKGGVGAPAGNTGGQPSVDAFTIPATKGDDSFFGTVYSYGGGFGGSSYKGYTPGIWGGAGGCGGGASGYNDDAGTYTGGTGVSGQGYRGGNSTATYYSGGGGGAGVQGVDSSSRPDGGIGRLNSILGIDYYWGGGGGGASYSLSTGGYGGNGGGGGGAVGTTYGGAGLNTGEVGGGGTSGSQTNKPGGDGGINTGGGGGGGSHYNLTNKGGDGGSGIVIVKYPISLLPGIPSMVFDGYSGYTSLGTFFNYQIFTISLWVCPGSTQNQYADIFDNNHNSTDNFVCQQDSNNTNVYSFGCASGVSWSSVAFTLTSDVWVFLTFTFNGNVTRGYVNGSLIGTGSSITSINYSSQNLRLGSHYANMRYWNGKMSNFIVYTKVLSASEIAQNYNAQKKKFGL